MYGEKAWGQSHKNTASSIEQVLEATPYKTGHLPPIMKTIQVRRIRNARNCWRSKDELISDVLRWTLSHGRAKVGRPVIYNSSVPIQDVAWKISRGRWTIKTSGERGSGKSVLAAWHDDDDTSNSIFNFIVSKIKGFIFNTTKLYTFWFYNSVLEMIEFVYRFF